MPRLSGAIERSFGLYRSSRHARQGQHHLDCSLVSLSGIVQALINLCWPRCSGRFQMYMLLLPKFKKFVREFEINVWVILITTPLKIVSKFTRF